jgi:hypothetical protein
MNEGLFLLLKLQARSYLRMAISNLKTPRRALMFIVYLFIITPVLGVPYFLSRIPDFRAYRMDPEILTLLISGILLFMCFRNLINDDENDQAIFFTEAEIDFLFPAPFSRKELLVYKVIGSNLAGIFIASLVISVWILPWISSWYPVFIGLFLALTFVNLVPIALALIRQTLVERAYTRMRRVILGIIILFLMCALYKALTSSSELTLAARIIHFRGSQAGRILFGIFDCFSHVILAGDLPGFMFWTTCAVGINSLLFLLLLKLDANYLEAMMVSSQKVSERLRRAKTLAKMPSLRRVPRTFPRFRFLTGGMANGWRQLISGWRRNSLRSWIAVAGTLFCSLVILHRSEHIFSSLPLYLFVAMTSIGSAAVVLLAFDFRRDIDRMDWLKMMPVSSVSIAFGQVMAPILSTILINILYLASLAVLVCGPRAELLVAAILSMPYTVLIFGYANFVFLLFPTRLKGGIQYGYSTEVIMVVKSIVFFGILAVAAATGLAGYVLFGHSTIVFWSVFGTVLSLFAFASIAAVGWAFDRFDPSIDVPP